MIYPCRSKDGYLKRSLAQAPLHRRTESRHQEEEEVRVGEARGHDQARAAEDPHPTRPWRSVSKNSFGLIVTFYD